jgi:hypothetical protein
VCLDAGKNGQIAGSDVVRDGWNAGSTAQPAYGFPGTPPSAIVHAVPEFIWGMSVKIRERGHRQSCNDEFRQLLFHKHARRHTLLTPQDHK